LVAAASFPRSLSLQHGRRRHYLAAAANLGNYQRVKQAAMFVELHPILFASRMRALRPYVVTLTPETTQQHIDRREILSRSSQFRATH
jgi:hypothetical protein